MTDEEIADKYAEEYFGKKTELVEVWKLKSCKENFLAGLKAGRPQWHKVADGKDLPLEAGLHIRVVMHNGDEYICETDYYEPSEDEIGFGHLLIQLYSNNEWIDDNNVYAWCEIPTFDKE